MFFMTAIFLITGAMIATSINSLVKEHRSMNTNDEHSSFAKF